MGAAFSVLGLVLVVAWSAVAFGLAGGLLASGVAALLVGVALSDVRLPRRKGDA